MNLLRCFLWERLAGQLLVSNNGSTRFKMSALSVILIPLANGEESPGRETRAQEIPLLRPPPVDFNRDDSRFIGLWNLPLESNKQSSYAKASADK